MPPRNPTVSLAVGAKGYGKSTLIAKLIKNSHHRNALIYKIGLNAADPAFKDFKEVSFFKYKGGKVIINAAEIEYKDFLEAILAKFRNGILLIDDASFYEMDTLSPQLKKIMLMCRHLGIDVIMVYHGLSDLPIKQLPYTNQIILFHTTDNAGYKAKKLPGMEGLEQAKNRIARQVAAGNKYYFEVIKLS